MWNEGDLGGNKVIQTTDTEYGAAMADFVQSWVELRAS